MLARRLVVCLDVRRGRVVKGVRFQDLQDRGDPAQRALDCELAGADEIVLLDVAATLEERGPMLEVVEQTARKLSIPLTVGGGVRSTIDAEQLLRSGADKVALNSAAVAHPELLESIAARFGSQCVVVCIDARRQGTGHQVWTHAGRSATGLGAAAWAVRAVELGAGEILVTSIDRDGTRQGYDLELTQSVAGSVRVPVVASGGAGSPEHVAQVVMEGGADAALVAGIVHEGLVTVSELKEAMVARGAPVRRTSWS